MLKIILKSSILIVCLLIFAGCSKIIKKISGNRDSTTIVDTTNLVTKDPVTGKDKVQLKYKVNKGDKFAYKIYEKNVVSEKDIFTNNQELVQQMENSFYYSKEVTDIDQSGIITYRVQFDSIIKTTKIDTLSVVYNSNFKDTAQNNQFPSKMNNALINTPFFIRVTTEGEITDVYGLEKIHENAIKSIGDTLNDAEKAQIRQLLGKETIQEILQQEYQYFPKQQVMVDSSWIHSINSQVSFAMAVFDIVNEAKYTLKNIETKNDHVYAVINAGLNVEFLNKEVKQKGNKFTIENDETVGVGTINLDLTRGCIVSKMANISMNISIRMSNANQSEKSVDKVTTNTSVTLLN